MLDLLSTTVLQLLSTRSWKRKRDVGGWVWVGEKCKGCSSLTLAGGGSRCRFRLSPSSPPPLFLPLLLEIFVFLLHLHLPLLPPYCILGLDALQPYPPSPKRPDCQYMHQAAPADTKKEFP